MAKEKSNLSKKLLLTNREALLAKYGASSVGEIEKAVKALAVADKKRGFATKLMYLDGSALGAARVTDATDPAENKAAFDALAKKYRPEYFVILGSRDVVPYQDLKNKLHDPADPESDSDRFAWSDLPYACEARYSQEISKFLGPTRVVGRLPDLTGARSPKYLLDLLAHSAKALPKPRPETAFALSARIWSRSTNMSVRNILGAVPTVHDSPKAGPKFSAAQLGDPIHFVNCHGNESDPTFSGEGPEDHYSDALDSRKLKGLRRGTVAAFECCYGAELYDPTGLPAMGIANTYLSLGAAAVLASTTIAYGPAVGNANADILCQVFIEQLLRGASLGRALLEARLAYANQQSVVDPYDEKTLAQFVLLGDPSLHPFADSGPKQGGAKAAVSAGVRASAHAARQQRRVRLMKAGEHLSKSCAYTLPTHKPHQAQQSLAKQALGLGSKGFRHVRVFSVVEPTPQRKSAGKAMATMPKASHVFVATRRRGRARSGTPRLEGLLAYWVNGNTVQIRLHSK